MSDDPVMICQACGDLFFASDSSEGACPRCESHHVFSTSSARGRAILAEQAEEERRDHR